MDIIKDKFPSIELKIRIPSSELQQYLKKEYYPCSEINTEEYQTEWSESEIKSAISEDVWEQLKRFICDAEVEVSIIKEK